MVILLVSSWLWKFGGSASSVFRSGVCGRGGGGGEMGVTCGFVLPF